MVWGTVMAQAVGVLKNERFSGGALVLMVAGLYTMYAWADSAHTEMEAMHQTLVTQEEFIDLKAHVEDGFEQMALNDASQQIRDIKLSRQIALSMGASPDEMALIDEQLEHAKNYKSCLVRRAPNCEHLREVE